MIGWVEENARKKWDTYFFSMSILPTIVFIIFYKHWHEMEYWAVDSSFEIFSLFQQEFNVF